MSVKKKVIAYIHTHWDREWYRDFQEFRLRLIEVIDEIIKSLESDELPSFYFDGQVAALIDYLEIYPNKKEIIKSLVKSKKLRIGPFYCSSDSFLVSGISLYKNLELGIKISKELGETDFIGYIPDSFGHSKDLPVILKSFNIKNVVLWRGLGDLKADLIWQDLNVTNLVQGYFQDFLHSDLPVEQKAKNLKQYIDKIADKSSDVILLPIGGDHLGLPKNPKKIIEKLNQIYDDYEIELGTPFDYFAKTGKRQKVSGEFLDNSKTFLLKGVYSSRPYIKKENAINQWLLERISEPLNALTSGVYGIKNRQNELDYAYLELIKNHAHDSIYGCTLDSVANDVMQRYKTVNTISNGIIKRIIRDLESENGQLAVINLSNYEYCGKVFIQTDKPLPKYLNAVKISTVKGFTDKKLYNIYDVPITEDITNINTYIVDVKNLKPLSLTNITKNEICTERTINSGTNFIENKYIKIEIIDNKITLSDKQKKEIYPDFIVIENSADIGDSYNFGALKGDKPIQAVIKNYEIKEKNHVRSVLKVIYEIKIPYNSTQKGRTKKVHNCAIIVEFTLYNQSKMAQIEAKWLNKSKNHILRLGFNLKQKIEYTKSEDLFSVVKRKFNTDYNIYNEIPAKKGVELKTNTAPMQRFVNTQNLTLITKGINEYEIASNRIYLTLLRATGIISNPKNPSRGTPAGPPIYTPKLQCEGENAANFAFAFTNDEEIMYKLTEEFYYPCVCLFTDKENKMFQNYTV